MADTIPAAFLPHVGDYVEFDSDRQTEKGPSGGKVSIVSHQENKCWINHSDTGEPGEEFFMRDLKVKRRTTHHRDGRPLWILI